MRRGGIEEKRKMERKMGRGGGDRSEGWKMNEEGNEEEEREEERGRGGEGGKVRKSIV